jgi:hypothetical protein
MSTGVRYVLWGTGQIERIPYNPATEDRICGSGYGDEEHELSAGEPSVLISRLNTRAIEVVCEPCAREIAATGLDGELIGTDFDGRSVSDEEKLKARRHRMKDEDPLSFCYRLDCDNSVPPEKQQLYALCSSCEAANADYRAANGTIEESDLIPF